MRYARRDGLFTGLFVVATLYTCFVAPLGAQRALRPLPEALAAAPSELVDRLRADLFTYFRFINRAWTARVCEAFADVTNPVIVRLHGDAHVEQFALTKDAWGLADFDESARGPSFVDIVRFLGSIEIATRQRGWTLDRDALWDRFFMGYRQGLSDPDYRPTEPDIVRRLRKEAPVTRSDYLEWGDRQMQTMDAADLRLVVAGFESLDRSVHRERGDLAPGYLAVVRAGWLRMGVGSAAVRKILVRVQGPTSDPEDDELLEAKQVASLDGLQCLEDSATPRADRVIEGSRQLGRIRHNILAVEPSLRLPVAAGRANGLEWWVSSWEPSYREVHLSDLQSVGDLGDIAFDAGVQLGANKLVPARRPALSSAASLESRLRKATSTLVEELITGWRELREQ